MTAPGPTQGAEKAAALAPGRLCQPHSPGTARSGGQGGRQAGTGEIAWSSGQPFDDRGMWEKADVPCVGGPVDGRSLLVPVNEDGVPPDVIDQNWLWVRVRWRVTRCRHGRRLRARARGRHRPAVVLRLGTGGSLQDNHRDPSAKGDALQQGARLSTATVTATGPDEDGRRREGADDRPRSRTRADDVGRAAQSL
jgi:hypothetical protein